MKYHLSEQDHDALLRIVEAEAGGEDSDGKLLVANVVLNRVNSEKFPDTVTEVVMQKEQGVARTAFRAWKNRILKFLFVLNISVIFYTEIRKNMLY